MTFRLRNYQREAIEHVTSRWAAGAVRVPIVLSTGLGKTQIFTTLADEWLNENPGRRVLIIAHTDELIEQAAKRMRQVAPRRRVGIVKAGQDDVFAEIIVSSRQTLASKARRERLRQVGMIVIDECHHAIRANTYGKILDHFGAFDDEPPVRVLGVTATLVRGDKSKLSSVWEECLFSRDILFGIRHGYLLDVRGERVIVPDMDMSRVRISGGDYRESDIGAELERTFAPEVIAKEYARLAINPAWDENNEPMVRRGIAFWPLVHTAYSGSEAFAEQGIRSAVVHGGTPRVERRATLQRFNLPLAHPEAIDVVHNAMVLTEGFDEPTADVVVIARPSLNDGLIQQMVGRVLRPNLEIEPAARDKALILDVRGKDSALSLHCLIDLSPERKQKIEDNPELSLLEIDEYLEAAMEDVEEQRAGASFSFESAEDYRGPAVTVAFDPLGRDKVWGRTPAGHHYIAAGTVGYVFLAPSVHGDPGTFDVVKCSKVSYVDRGGVRPWQSGTEHLGLPLEMALNWAEDVAVEIGGPGTLTLNKRKAAWRKAKPTEAQMKLAYARRIPGVTRRNASLADEVDCGTQIYESTLSKGELSEALDAAQAAKRIDPLVAAVMAIKQKNESEGK